MIFDFICLFLTIEGIRNNSLNHIFLESEFNSSIYLVYKIIKIFMFGLWKFPRNDLSADHSLQVQCKADMLHWDPCLDETTHYEIPLKLNILLPTSRMTPLSRKLFPSLNCFSSCIWGWITQGSRPMRGRRVNLACKLVIDAVSQFYIDWRRSWVHSNPDHLEERTPANYSSYTGITHVTTKRPNSSLSHPPWGIVH